MILRSIKLTNFRSYYGTQTIDLSPRAQGPDRNIVVIGGLNGAGKTSLLQAIHFTILGVVDAFKFIENVERKGDGRDNIDRTFDGLLNRKAREEGNREAEVALSFQDDDNTTFTIRRLWRYDSRGKFKDEEPVVTTEQGELSDKERYEDFLKNRIPPEVVKFFMFDGEKIQIIADDEVGDSVLDGINSLLGFHVLGSLISDMDTLQDDYRKRAKRRNRQEEEMGDLRSKEKKLANQVREIEDEQIEVEDRVEELKHQNGVLMDDLNALLGGHGKSPKDLQRQLDLVSNEVHTLKDRVLNAIDSQIIPAMPFGLLRKLDEQLRGEEERSQWDEGRRKVEPQRNRLIDKVFSEDSPATTPPLIEDQIAFLRQRVRDEWEALFNPPPPGIAETVIHNHLSNEERAQTHGKCQRVLESGSIDLRSLLDQLDSAERKARNIRQQIEHIGDGARANRIIEDKAKIDRELGEAEQKWDSLKRQLLALATDLKEVKRDIANKEAELRESGQSGDRANFVRKVKRAVQLYQEALRPKKRDEVAAHLTEMYKRLARKEDVVQQICLDEKTYRPELLDRNGSIMPLHSLSAGEREIYALSLLWALAKTSRRSLPVVIDTPLARLDSAHRAAIVKRYLPQAGPQVIVLSTDTEIDRENFDLIDHHFAATLRLDFDQENEQTTVQEGYFSFT